MSFFRVKGEEEGHDKGSEDLLEELSWYKKEYKFFTFQANSPGKFSFLAFPACYFDDPLFHVGSMQKYII